MSRTATSTVRRAKLAMAVALTSAIGLLATTGPARHAAGQYAKAGKSSWSTVLAPNPYRR